MNKLVFSFIVLLCLTPVLAVNFTVTHGNSFNITIHNETHLSISGIIVAVDNGSPLNIISPSSSECPDYQNITYTWVTNVSLTDEAVEVSTFNKTYLYATEPGLYTFSRDFTCYYSPILIPGEVKTNCDDLLQNATLDSTGWYIDRLVDSWDKYTNLSDYTNDLFNQLVYCKEGKEAYGSQKQYCEIDKNECHESLTNCTINAGIIASNLTAEYDSRLQTCELARASERGWSASIISTIIWIILFIIGVIVIYLWWVSTHP